MSDTVTANGVSISLSDIEKAGTATGDVSLLQVTNTANASSMTNTRSSILFNQWYYDASTPAVVDAAKITVGTEGNWTSTGSTQDSYIGLCTAADGTVAEKMRVDSAGVMSIVYIKSYDNVAIGIAEDGTAAPAAEELITNTNGKIRVRKFDSASVEDVTIPWPVPEDIDPTKGIKFKVRGVITESTAPASGGGVSFKLSGYCSGTGDTLTGTFGTEVESATADLYAAGVTAQYELFVTTLSTTVTVTDLAAGELAMLHFERDTADSDDDYAQDVGVIEVIIEYYRKLVA